MNSRESWIKHNKIMQSRNTEFHDVFIVPSFNPVRSFEINTDGEDWFVGDVHGMFTQLDVELERSGFDARCDRLFMVGDLIDRGPDSFAAVDFLERHYVHSVRGNHDQFFLDAQHCEVIRNFWVNHAGGLWSMAISQADLNALYNTIESLPIAMNISTAYGRFGVVHAEVPVGATWDEFTVRLEDEQKTQSPNDYVASLSAQWSRFRIESSKKSNFRKYMRETSLPYDTHAWINDKIPNHVDGVTAVIMGHSSCSSAMFCGNHAWIDAGAVRNQQRASMGECVFGLFRASEIAEKLNINPVTGFIESTFLR